MSQPIFREYIGVNSYSTDFPIDIIRPEIDFHFILAFASEEYNEDGKGNGHFKEIWNEDHFGLEKVKKLKENFPNVKVIISIGGRGVETPFDPAEESIWTRNAVHSLKVLIGKYKNASSNLIDGIDINYDTIKTSNDLFVKCIGQVITKLRNDDNLNIDVVSIAPSEKNELHYRNLFWANQDNINLVNYQFYNQEKTVSTVADFVVIYDNLVKGYTPKKVLPGTSTYPNTKISPEIFIAGCILLKEESKLPGAFLLKATESLIPQIPPYNESLEDILIKILTDEFLAISSK